MDGERMDGGERRGNGCVMVWVVKERDSGWRKWRVARRRGEGRNRG